MASRDQRPGVRGPRGPAQPSGSGSPRTSSPKPAGEMSTFQRLSLPALRRLSSLPKWVLVVALSVLLVLGIIQTGALAWLGALILGLLTLFFLWLLLLSWPALPPSGRLLRGIVVVALAGATVLKALGRF